MGVQNTPEREIHLIYTYSATQGKPLQNFSHPTANLSLNFLAPTSISLSDCSVHDPLAAPPHLPQMAPSRGCPAQHTPRRLEKSAHCHGLIQQRASLGLWMEKTDCWCFYFQTYNSPFATEQKHKKMQFIKALVLEEKQLPLCKAGKRAHQINGRSFLQRTPSWSPA